MKYLFANWKMYLDHAESMALIEAVKALSIPQDVELAVFPNFLSIPSVAWAIQGSTVHLGAQNCAWVSRGAYTGAVSAEMVRGVGCEYVLAGHSERRHIFGETDTAVRQKVEASLAAGLKPVICIGETKEEKDAGKREARLAEQLASVFEDLSFASGQIFVAYEPVWAIGTGDACDPQDADDVHGWIASEIKKYTAVVVPILYGGSVDAKNVASYTTQPMIAGVLVGGASTKADSLAEMLSAIAA